MFERATGTLLSKNMLLYFAYADYEEGRVKYDKVHQIYQKYLDIPDIDPTLVSFLINDIFIFNIFALALVETYYIKMLPNKLLLINIYL